MPQSVHQAIHSIDLPNYRVNVCRLSVDVWACAACFRTLPIKPTFAQVEPATSSPSESPINHLTWIGAWEVATGQLVGAFRLDEFSANSSRYPNLNPFAQQYRRTHRMVDGGAHLVPHGHARAMVFEGLCTVALSYLVANGIAGVYILVRTGQVRAYSSLGFQVVTAPFQSLDFRSRWQGMLLCLETLPVLWAEPIFQQSWRRQTGVPLRVVFWRRVMERLPDVQIRTSKRLVVDVVTERPALVSGQKKIEKK